MTDHAQEAAIALQAAKETPADEIGTDPWLLQAQVHATLALVEAQNRATEQQRIANLIALIGNKPTGLEHVGRDALGHPLCGDFQIMNPHPEIAEALGLRTLS